MARREETIRVRAPATTANFGPGFDVVGMALDGLHDEFQISKSNRWRVRNSGTFKAATRSRKSVFAFVWKAMKKKFVLPGSLNIQTFKSIKTGAGMGSSASEAAATAFAVNRLFKLSLSENDLVFWAGKGEAFAAGTPHYDNVGPAVRGGVTIMLGPHPRDILRYDPPNLHCMLVINDRIKKGGTAAARRAIPLELPKRHVFSNMPLLAALLVGLKEGHDGVQGHENRILGALHDQLHEPYREKAGILPHLGLLRKLALEHGFNAVASGAGPTLLVLAPHPVSPEDRAAFEEEVKALYHSKKIKTDLRWMRPSAIGVHEVRNGA